jgi:hypothetical protein
MSYAAPIAGNLRISARALQGIRPYPKLRYELRSLRRGFSNRSS